MLKQNNFRPKKLSEISKDIESTAAVAILNSEALRREQLSSLLSWKATEKEKAEVLSQEDCEYYESNKLTSENLNNYADDIQALLVNSSWSRKNESYYFDMEKFVIKHLIKSFSKKFYLLYTIFLFEKKINFIHLRKLCDYP